MDDKSVYEYFIVLQIHFADNNAGPFISHCSMDTFANLILKLEYYPTTVMHYHTFVHVL